MTMPPGLFYWERDNNYSSPRINKFGPRALKKELGKADVNIVIFSRRGGVSGSFSFFTSFG